MSEMPSTDVAIVELLQKCRTDWMKKNEELRQFITESVNQMKEKIEDVEDSFLLYHILVNGGKGILSEYENSKEKTSSIDTDREKDKKKMLESREFIENFIRVVEVQEAINSNIISDLLRLQEAKVKQELAKLKQLKRIQDEEDEVASLIQEDESKKIENEMDLANDEVKKWEEKLFTSDMKRELHINEQYKIGEFEEEQEREIMKIFSHSRLDSMPTRPDVTCAVLVINEVLHTFFDDEEGHAEKHLLNKLKENAKSQQRDDEDQKKDEKFEPNQASVKPKKKLIKVFMNYSPCNDCQLLFNEFTELDNAPEITLVFVRPYNSNPVPLYAQQFTVADWCYLKGLLWYFQNSPFHNYCKPGKPTSKY